MREARETLRNERGIGLVVALLVLLVLSLLAAVLMMSVQTETKISGHNLRGSQALNTAEAGVAEAVARIRSMEIPSDGTNPRMVAQIFNVAAGSVPTLGADSIPMPTAQPAGSWLDYSRATKGPGVLTVEYKTDPGKTVIYKYDATKPVPVQTVSGLPIFVITSVGRRGTDTRKIVTEVIQKPVIANVKAALAAATDIKFIGNAVVCGYNHSADTPQGAGENGRGSAPDCQPFETGSGDLWGSWTTGGTTNGGAAGQSGWPSANVSGQTGFYAGPWEALGMPQADFYAWLGPAQTTVPADLHAITYLDNNGIPQDATGAWGIHGVNGEGLLYVDGDLTINAGFNYRGLIYVEGDLLWNGQAWVLGGVIVKGKSEIKQTGGSTLLYSSDAITRALARYGGQFVTLSWREVPL
jgi:hypothetical protein